MTRLYGLPGSHPTMAVQAMLERKGIDYRRIDLVPFLARAIVRRGMGMPQNTVPVLAVGGRRIQGSREIGRELDRLRPAPPLFPADHARDDSCILASRPEDGRQTAANTVARMNASRYGPYGRGLP